MNSRGKQEIRGVANSRIKFKIVYRSKLEGSYVGAEGGT